MMQRVMLTGFGEPPDVYELETISPDLEPSAGEVIVVMEAASINPSDLRLARGSYGIRPTLPFAVGAEGVGRVVETGSGVDASLCGKRVLIVPNSEQGTWSTHAAVQLRNVVPISEDADALQLAMLGINPATAYLMLRDYAKLMPGDWVAQTAANSAVGQYVIALARMAGLKTLNIVRSEEAAAQVRSSGGDRIVIQGENLRKDIEAALDGHQLSLVLDPVGGDLIGTMIDFMRTNGAIVAYGNQSGQPPVFPPRDFIFKGLQLHGFWLSRWLHAASELEILDLYRKLGTFVAEGMPPAVVQQVYGLDRFKEAISQAMESGRQGKILFKFGE